MFFFFQPYRHLKCSLFMSEAPHFPGDRPLLPWSPDNIGGHCATHVHLSLKDGEATLSTQTCSIEVEHESMDVQSVEGVYTCTLSGLSLHASVCALCLCVSSLSQPAESAVSLRLTAGQKLEQEMNSDSPSASHKFLFSYSDTKDNISALH